MASDMLSKPRHPPVKPPLACHPGIQQRQPPAAVHELVDNGVLHGGVGVQPEPIAYGGSHLVGQPIWAGAWQQPSPATWQHAAPSQVAHPGMHWHMLYPGGASAPLVMPGSTTMLPAPPMAVPGIAQSPLTLLPPTMVVADPRTLPGASLCAATPTTAAAHGGSSLQIRTISPPAPTERIDTPPKEMTPPVASAGRAGRQTATPAKSVPSSAHAPRRFSGAPPRKRTSPSASAASPPPEADAARAEEQAAAHELLRLLNG